MDLLKSLQIANELATFLDRIRPNEKDKNTAIGTILLLMMEADDYQEHSYWANVVKIISEKHVEHISSHPDTDSSIMEMLATLINKIDERDKAK